MKHTSKGKEIKALSESIPNLDIEASVQPITRTGILTMLFNDVIVDFKISESLFHSSYM